MFSTPAEALQFIKEQAIAMVDLKICSIQGRWLHVTVPAESFSQQHFEEGLGYDGSSGSGFTSIESGDVNARPDPGSAFIDPFWDTPTLSFICDTVTADAHEPFPFDPRCTLDRAVAALGDSGIADEVLMAPEFEFQVYDKIEIATEPYHSCIRLHCSETHADGSTLPLAPRGGYMAAPPRDQLHNLRSEMARTLQDMGIPVRYHHHEVSAAGQCELEVGLEPATLAADHAMLIRYVIKNVARRNGKVASFMPKPVFGEPGNGMHVHQKLRLGGRPVFYDEEQRNYADLSETALQYIGGLLLHGGALSALTNPSTNSFKRLVEGYEAPVNLFFSLGNRSAAIRIPKYAVSADEKRIEYRPPDFTCNVYYALAAMMLAGLDGIVKRVDPGAHHMGPFDVDIAKQDAAFRSRIAAIPRSLGSAVEALQADCEFLRMGGVFSDGFVEQWIGALRRQHLDIVDRRPHPWEYALYLDC